MEAEEIARLRETFFANTRKPTIAFYVVFAVAAVGAAAWAVSLAAVPALAGILVGFAAMGVLFVLSPRMPVSARAARAMLVPVIAAGAVGAQFIDLDVLSEGWAAGVLGGLGGGLAGTVAGTALIRRRLAHDDELLLRQQRLGFDPERPWSWLRD